MDTPVSSNSYSPSSFPFFLFSVRSCSYGNLFCKEVLLKPGKGGEEESRGGKDIPEDIYTTSSCKNE